jgi:predicted aconitase
MNAALQLNAADRAMLAGEQGEAAALAMRILARAAAVMGARELIDVTRAHIDGCLYHGQASLDFVDRLLAAGGRVRIPTTLNVGSMDLIHPELFRGDAALASAGKRLMEAHLALGCESTFTCAPYQQKLRPRLGEQIAWAESNAIVFANSVLGARTNRYGDFIDLCAAITGRAPYAGLHLSANRHGQRVFALPAVASVGCGRDLYFALAGLVIGALTGSAIPVLLGLPGDASEDELKALGAAAASTGAVALFHAVGITPEAPTLDAALGGRACDERIAVSPAQMLAMRDRLNQAAAGEALSAVCLGTPHFSLTEFAGLLALLDASPGPLRCAFYVNTSRFILWELEQSGSLQRLQARGITLVTDTCTYITPILREVNGVAMTNSGKWAHYAPANIGVRVAYASMAECVASALQGKVVFDDAA